jgi:hypothetical protein
MKMAARFLLSLIASILCIAGLQIAVRGAGAKIVPTAPRLPITQPGESGRWEGPDLTVEYGYTRHNRQMDLSGSVRLADSLRLGFTLLRDFHLDVVFFDERGGVIESNALVTITNRGSLDAIAFQARLGLPPNAVSMAFGYRGEAAGGGGSGAGSGITSFWFNPVH